MEEDNEVTIICLPNFTSEDGYQSNFDDFDEYLRNIKSTITEGESSGVIVGDSFIIGKVNSEVLKELFEEWEDK